MRLIWNESFKRRFMNNFELMQKYLDNLVIPALQEYVSYKEGDQAKSIRNKSVPGSGKVWINVLYAHYQAYNPRIKKMNGKRGTYPFERMKSDKNSYFLRQLAAYSRRINK